MADNDLDLPGILRASQALSSQRTLRDLASRVTEVLAALTGATRVALVVAAEGEWQLVDTAQQGDRMLPIARAAGAGLLPLSALSLIERLDAPLQVPDTAQDERFARDPYFAQRESASLLFVPVLAQGSRRAVLFLEDTAARAAFEAERLDAVMLIAGQLGVSLSNTQLYDELAQREQERSAEIRKLQSELIASAQRAATAQMANNVLHNVGNVLNSVTVAAFGLRERVQGSRSEGLSRAVALIKEHDKDLPGFIAQDTRGRMLPQYLEQLDATLRQEREETLGEIAALLRSVEHIAAVIRSQQSNAGTSWLKQPVMLTQLVDEALSMNDALLARGTVIVREDDVTREVELDRTRLMQILVNLIANANEAMAESAQRTLTVGATLLDDAQGKRVRITVGDSGHGIAAEDLSRLFAHGFTTKKDGHGFGLHSAALTAMEMGGRLSAHSDGPGRGATFTLEIPVDYS